MPNPEDFGAFAIDARAKTVIPRSIYADAVGGIGFWNAGAEATFGHSAAEVSGKRVDLIVPEEYRAMHWAGF